MHQVLNNNWTDEKALLFPTMPLVILIYAHMAVCKTYFRAPSSESQHLVSQITSHARWMIFAKVCALVQEVWWQTLRWYRLMLRYGRWLMIWCLAIRCNALQLHSTDTDGTRCKQDCFHVMPLLFMFICTAWM